ncbi:MAG: DUF4340 domain-containing protein [Clostridia bacterium]|nr:DUF4340 domain-containing protein [Clostridia bacterium]
MSQKNKMLQKFNGLSKRKRSIVLLSAALAVVLVLTAVLALTAPEEAPNTQPATTYLFNIKRTDIRQVKVKNEAFVLTATLQEDGTYALEQMKDVEVSSTSIVYLLMDVAMIDDSKVANEAPESLSDYGLDKPASTVIITMKDGSTHTLKIGNATAFNDGYFVMADDDPAVYIADKSLSDTCLQGPTYYISNTILPTMEETQAAMMTNIRIYEKDVKDVKFVKKTEAQQEADKLNSYNTHIMTSHPGYNPSTDMMSRLAQNISGLTATSVVHYAPTASQLKACGLDAPQYIVEYELNGASYKVKFGNKLNDTDIYAMRDGMNAVFAVTLSTDLEYCLDSPLINYVERLLYMRNIANVNKLTLTVGGRDHAYEFLFDQSGEDPVITYNGTTMILQDFRRFYTSVIGTLLQNYAEKPENANKLLEVRFDNDDGNTVTVVYYELEARKAFVTINGVGEFYVLRDDVETIISNLDKVIRGEEVPRGY